MNNSNYTIKDHKSLFRQLLAGMYDAVLITDPNGHLLEMNGRVTDLFGYQADEVADEPIVRFIPGVKGEVVTRLRRGLDEGRRLMLNASCLRKDGTTFPAEITVSAIDLFDPGDLVFTVRSIAHRRNK